jgi:hypothetical protein
MRNEAAFHSPLQLRDSQKQTVGCRHTNPDICAKNNMPKKCAFVNPEGICYSPPASWPKQFVKLTEAAKEAKQAKRP